ncbi:MAG: TonB-dependent receptor [Marinilabiliaceae bacterium]|nr:TonB-dependent receptor [Marinilabiliaceae bacterium]
MKENLRFFSVVFFLSMHLLLFGQGKTITGKVTDDTKAPLPGVSVVIEGTTQGTITDVNGGYSVAVPDDSKVLVYSFIGFESQKVEVAGKTVINVLLKPENIGIDEVVVVGYGTMKKSDLSGASVSVGEDKIKGSVITNLDQSLQGRAAGVTSLSTSGAPGSSSSIRVRGQATINSNAEPLYVIDGVIIQGGGNSGSDFGLGDALGNGSTSTISPLSTINPSDIVSMEILKDASATAIYGAQGANGVVLITTKRGKAGDAKFTYEGMMAWQRQMKRLDMMNLREFAGYYNDLASTGELTASEDYADPSLLGVGTNWQDAIFRTAMQHQHQISAQGGSDKVNYYVSGSYMKQDGTIIGSNFKRYSMRSNLDAQMKPWLKLGLNAMYSGTDERLTLADSDEGIVNYSLTTPPDIPIYNIDGSYATIVKEGYTSVNPIAMALMDDILLGRNKLSGSIFADVTPLKDLTWHTELGFDINNSKAETYSPMVNLGTWTRASNESSVQKNNSTFWQAKNYLTYSGRVQGNHSYTIMLGQEAWESEYDFERIANTGLPSDAVHNPALGTGTPTIGYGFGSSSMVSVFGRFNYNFNDRYLLTYTYRRDGSSNFGPDNRWAGFHAAATSWRFSNENFFASLLPIINNGKLRLGWGQTGNSNIGGYKWGVAITKMPTGLGIGYRPSNIANPGIKWETQEQLNAGLDLSFFQSRINLTVDVYQKTSEDMLMKLQLPSYMGTRGNQSSAMAAPYGNYGSIENKGLEITLGGRPIVGQFEWESEFQISFNKNKLVSLDGAASSHIEGYGQWDDLVSLTEVGQSLYNFYGYQVEGVYKDLADIQNSAKPVKYPTADKNTGAVVFNRASTVWVGDIKYKDLNNDGVIDEKDRTNIGSPLPKFTFGFNNTFRYKNFDLNIFVNGSYGNKVYNYLAMKLTHMNSAWSNQLTDVSDRARLEAIDVTKDYTGGVDVYGDPTKLVYSWYDDVTNVRVKNSGTSTPRATTADPNDNDRVSDRYVEDGSYVRIKNITLGYTLPKSLIQKVKLENVRVYANFQNIYTFTNYSGFDPEIGASTSSANVYGLDNGRYPSPTVMSFGLNVTF